MKRLEDFAELVEQTALEIVWDQWAALGADVPSSSRGPKQSLVDPEALLLLTLSLLPADGRLATMTEWWSQTCSALCSLQRIQRLLPLFPPAAEERLRHAAALAVACKDRRWERLAAPEEIVGPSKRATCSVDVLTPQSLILRVRLLFGVNPTADVITFLLGRGDQAAAARDLALATAYSRSSIHQILERLIAAAIVARPKHRPGAYIICAEAWQEVLGRNVIRSGVRGKTGFRRGYLKNTAAPMWLCWPQIFSYLAILHEACTADHRTASEYVRDVERLCRQYSDHRRVFIDQRLPLQALYGARQGYVAALHDSVAAISTWYRMHS